MIDKPSLLETSVLPLVYKQSRFASFSRQLNVSLVFFGFGQEGLGAGCPFVCATDDRCLLLCLDIWVYEKGTFGLIVGFLACQPNR